MDFKKFKNEAKKAMEERGGSAGLKGDLAELGGIAKGKGSASEKAKAAASALKSSGNSAKAPRR